MGERRIALVAVDSQWRDPKGTFYSFSYGIEKLQAAIRSAPDLQDVEVQLLDLRSNDPDEYFERIREFRPSLVGLSAYVWSLEVFAGLTAKLRAFDPELAIVAGGPAARRSVFDLAPHHALRDRLDAVIPGEGEQTIRDLVRLHQEPDWLTRVPGLMLPTRGLWRNTAVAERPDIESYPSPYQLGIAPREKTGYVETFRGCPIHCAFCQWGDQKSDRVHSARYLAEHLRGLKNSDAQNVFFLDAAFNLSPRAFRALVAAEAEVGVLRDMVVHGHLYPTHLQEEHLAFFEHCGQVQASVGIQSFDEAVLERLGRPFDIQRFQSVLKQMKGRLDVDIELIFGLPGDNPASFRRTFETALELGSSVKVFKCLVLPDALIERSSELNIDFDPNTFALMSAEGWTREELDREWAWLYSRAEQARDPILNDDWVGFVINPSEGASAKQVPSVSTQGGFDSKVVAHLRSTIGSGVSGWDLRGVRSEGAGLMFDLRGPDGDVVLAVERLVEGQRFFVSKETLAYSHRGHVGEVGSRGLRQVIEAVHGTALRVLGAGVLGAGC
ncbi:MAG: radical SAM protein [Polyangiaceae bacterium]